MSLLRIPHPLRRLSLAAVRVKLRARMRRAGYSKEQAATAVGKMGDGTILAKLQEFFTKYGPTILAILKVVIALLPLLLAASPPPAGPPVTDVEAIDAIEMEETECECQAPLEDAEAWAAAGIIDGTGAAQTSELGHGVHYTRTDENGNDKRHFIGPFRDAEHAEVIADRLASRVEAGEHVRSILVRPVTEDDLEHQAALLGVQ